MEARKAFGLSSGEIRYRRADARVRRRACLFFYTGCCVICNASIGVPDLEDISASLENLGGNIDLWSIDINWMDWRYRNE